MDSMLEWAPDSILIIVFLESNEYNCEYRCRLARLDTSIRVKFGHHTWSLLKEPPLVKAVTRDSYYHVSWQGLAWMVYSWQLHLPTTTITIITPNSNIQNLQTVHNQFEGHFRVRLQAISLSDRVPSCQIWWDIAQSRSISIISDIVFCSFFSR